MPLEVSQIYSRIRRIHRSKPRLCSVVCCNSHTLYSDVSVGQPAHALCPAFVAVFSSELLAGFVEGPAVVAWQVLLAQLAGQAEQPYGSFECRDLQPQVDRVMQVVMDLMEVLGLEKGSLDSCKAACWAVAFY